MPITTTERSRLAKLLTTAVYGATVSERDIALEHVRRLLTRVNVGFAEVLDVDAGGGDGTLITSGMARKMARKMAREDR